jgi:hypothetical protein
LSFIHQTKNNQMDNKAYLFDLHKEHVEWKKTMKFYDDELKVYRNRLSEVSIKNTAKDVKEEVEKFQNQFLIQKNEIGYLMHNINLAEHEIKKNIEENPIASDHRKVDENVALKDRYEIFIKIFETLKDEFNAFAGRNM